MTSRTTETVSNDINGFGIVSNNKLNTQNNKEEAPQTKLFEDKAFPCNPSLIDGKGEFCYWKRPRDLSKNPQFFVKEQDEKEEASRFDVIQGNIGDCWLISSIGSLTLNKDLFSNVVPEQNFGKNYDGHFQFRFWKNGEWKDVIVDDRLPIIRGKLTFSHSQNANEFWCALLEKAYAKFCGSYDKLNGGMMNEAMQHFTGGITETYELCSSPSDLYEIMLKAHKNSALMGAAILQDCDNSTSSNEEPRRVGLIPKHAYSITKVQYVHKKNDQKETVALLRLRNPLVNVEWKGDWKDCDKQWECISTEEKEMLELKCDAKDGEFWMSFQHFQQFFDTLEICHLTPESLWHDEEKTKINSIRWNVSTHHGQWIKGESAGGSIKYPETFWRNPQYRIELNGAKDCSNKNDCRLLVALLQKSTFKFLSIGFVIVQLTSLKETPEKLDRNCLSKISVIADSGKYTDQKKEVTCKFRLSSGTYCIIPTTDDPDLEGEYLLRIYTENFY